MSAEMLRADQVSCGGQEGGQSEETGMPLTPARLHPWVVRALSWHPLLWVKLRQRISILGENLEILAIWVNQVDQTSTAMKCQMKMFPVSTDISFSLWSSAYARLSAHELQWEGKPSRGCLLLRLAELTHNICVWNQGKTGLVGTWAQNLSHAVGSNFASNGCEKPCKSLSGNLNFRRPIKFL